MVGKAAVAARVVAAELRMVAAAGVLVAAAAAAAAPELAALQTRLSRQLQLLMLISASQVLTP